MWIVRHIISGICTCLMVMLSVSLFAQSAQQSPYGIDSTYIKFYPDKLTGRFFLSQKYTVLDLKAKPGYQNLHYRPNTTLNLGVGVSYRLLSLNLAIGFPFMNPDIGQGKTKYLDLQSHIYPKHWSIDFNTQFYKGYFLNPKGRGTNNPDKFYQRPDMDINLFGVQVYHLSNGNKYSYKASMIQTEWQTRSAGSWLLGGEIYGGTVSADSAIVPSMLKEEFAQNSIHKVRFFEFGPGGGYAYTLVIKKHFFLMASVTLNMDLGFSREFLFERSHDQWSLRPNFMGRAAAGYNSRFWSLTGTWVGNRIGLIGASSDDPYFFQTGNFRVTFAKRFTPGPRMARKLSILDASRK